MEKYKKRYRIPSSRLLGYNYSQNGYYFVTICTHSREHLFGDISNEQMILNQNGNIIHDVWTSLDKHHSIKLDVFQIMPNHIHGILIIESSVETLRATSLPNYKSNRISPVSGSLSVVIRSFKSECTKQIRLVSKNLGMIIWQSRFYECIIREENDYLKIKQYIDDNPKRWAMDTENI